MRRRKSFDPAALARLRAMPSEDALVLLAIYLKADPTYSPTKDITSRRWQVRTARGEFEILTTGVKWFDTRAKIGGGGAIDLTMHLNDVSFVDAVKLLQQRAICHG